MKDLQSWIINHDFAVFVHMIDGEQLIYHGGSGATHWLGAEPGFVFHLLWQYKIPMTQKLLIDQARRNGFTQLDSLLLEAILNELDALHLVKNS
ncbi:MAG: hypothetical protein Q7U66_09930 [Methylobacter sp.]|nr:hypothetical protein [Methylobacter sp.]